MFAKSGCCLATGGARKGSAMTRRVCLLMAIAMTVAGAHFYGSMGATHLNQPVFSNRSSAWSADPESWSPRPSLRATSPRRTKWIGQGVAGANANVTFRNDHAISKSQFGLI